MDLAQPDVVLKCDGNSGACLALPDKAPRVYVPAKATGEENHKHPPVTLAFPHLHYCQACWDREMRLSLLLDDKVKARIEHRGRKIWPHGVKPDFDAALIEPIDVFSPEYAAYMRRIGLNPDGLGYEMHETTRERLAGQFFL